MSVGCVTMLTLAKFGICAMIFLTPVAGKCYLLILSFQPHTHTDPVLCLFWYSVVAPTLRLVAEVLIWSELDYRLYIYIFLL